MRQGEGTFSPAVIHIILLAGLSQANVWTVFHCISNDNKLAPCQINQESDLWEKQRLKARFFCSKYHGSNPSTVKSREGYLRHFADSLELRLQAYEKEKTSDRMRLAPKPHKVLSVLDSALLTNPQFENGKGNLIGATPSQCYWSCTVVKGLGGEF